MKLHDFILSQQSEDDQKLRDLGKALAQPAPLRVSEVTKKGAVVKSPTDMVDDGVEGMDAAVATITGDHKTVQTKIRHYD